MSATETLEAIAVETGYTNSAVATAAYTIASVLPAPTFSPAAGTYTASQSVTISDATAGTTIYYTTNGTTPTTSSTKYSGAITVSATETIEAIAVETGYTNSAVATAAYTITPVLPAPTFSPAAGTYTTSAVSNDQRRDGGYDHLLHHQRHHAYYLVHHVQRSDHGERDGDDGSISRSRRATPTALWPRRLTPLLRCCPHPRSRRQPGLTPHRSL